MQFYNGVHSELPMWLMNFGGLPSEGLPRYLRTGKPIPDELLPGRRLAKMKRTDPEFYQKVITTDWQNVAPWWIKIMCGK